MSLCLSLCFLKQFLLFSVTLCLFLSLSVPLCLSLFLSVSLCLSLSFSFLHTHFHRVVERKNARCLPRSRFGFGIWTGFSKEKKLIRSKSLKINPRYVNSLFRFWAFFPANIQAKPTWNFCHILGNFLSNFVVAQFLLIDDVDVNNCLKKIKLPSLRPARAYKVFYEQMKKNKTK